MAKDSPSFGKPSAKTERNPYFPNETAYDGGAKGIVSNHGSNKSIPMAKGDPWEGLPSKGGPRGSTTDDIDRNGG